MGSLADLIKVCPLIVIAVFILVFLSCQIRDRNKVVSTSVRLKKLNELNQQTYFEMVPKQFVFRTALETKQKYDNFNFDKYLDDKIKNSEELRSSAEKIQKNRQLYQEYRNNLCNLASVITEEEAKKIKLSYNRYLKIEASLFEKNQLTEPTLNCNIVCYATYSSPQRRNHYSKNKTFSIFEVPERYENLMKIEEERNSEEYRRKRERSKMSDKLRYSIMKRDGFKCVICGRRADDGIKLHVDHIIPVAKGGTTIESNLRTLCESCNWGKSDSIE
ncbi:MAG: HNH endonuclease [Oscillospiraceae bacterium]|nr:HNH endonuclease [Oscillospiraceae bacterium]